VLVGRCNLTVSTVDKQLEDALDVIEHRYVLVPLKGAKGAQQPADQKEFEYGTEEEPQEEVPMEEEETNG